MGIRRKELDWRAWWGMQEQELELGLRVLGRWHGWYLAEGVESRGGEGGPVDSRQISGDSMKDAESRLCGCGVLKHRDSYMRISRCENRA